jgi:hypothetical protein
MISAKLFLAARRPRLLRLADWLVVGVVASLPWSTSATGILIALWVIVFLPALDWAAFREQAQTWAGGLPIVLFCLAVLGIAWASVPLADRLHGAASFVRLLVIPLLLTQFRSSQGGYPASCF